MAARLPLSCSVLFLVTEKLPSSAVCMRNDVTAYIMRQSEQADLSKEEAGRPAESRQNLKSIEISFNSSHHGKIALYLDRIY